MTREGTPLLAGPVDEAKQIASFVDAASDLLWQLNPANPQAARDRRHYLRAVRPVEFARGTAPPLLLADPLDREAMRAHGVQRIAAQLEVEAAGDVTQVQLLNAASLPPALVAPIQEDLRKRALCVPAISGGAAVAGSVFYTWDAEEDEQRAANAAWLQGVARVDVPLTNWLVLKPVRVEEKVFTELDRVEGGKVLLKPVTASRADGITRRVETNAFISDWFWEEGGPNSLKPRAGDKQEVDGQKLVWKVGLPRFLGQRFGVIWLI